MKNVRRGEEEVIMIVRWESEEAWKAWEKSPEHIAGHKEKDCRAWREATKARLCY